MIIYVKPTILFLNHQVKECGVYQYGYRLGQILIKFSHINISYIEIGSYEEYEHVIKGNYDAIIYNYHTLTMSWLNDSCIQKKWPNIGIYHESTIELNFDYIINTDPTAITQSKVLVLPRPLLVYEGSKQMVEEDKVIIGSFGFGFKNKGFEKIVTYVNEQFDEALIRLNITYAHYGDSQGQQGQEIADRCRSLITKEGIRLEISHQFMTETQLLDFLNGNTINLFLYDDMPDRGCSSVIDYAASIDRPIGISNSAMFRHIYRDEICVYKTPIQQIINFGLDYIKEFKEINSIKNLCKIFDNFFMPILKKSMINNTILTDIYRKKLEPTIAELYRLVPDMMSRKIPRANVQQAFVFDYIQNNFLKTDSFICVGSHEDTCAAALKTLGYNITEIDPSYNCSLHEYVQQANIPHFDVVFSISVIEHVANDDEFVDDLCKLLKPGGTAILTCDFNNSYQKGQPVPSSDYRFVYHSRFNISF